jgi:uncharacterized glyoxalase superfamily protein PhnB
MPFLNNYNSVNKEKKRINTSPTKTDIESAKKSGIDLGKSWRAYSKEVRVHVYVSSMDKMVNFYNQILEFPVVKYWRYSDGDGTMIDIGGNLIELFSKGSRNYSNKSFHGNVSLSIKVKNVIKLHGSFCKKNIKISELVENDWGDASFSLIDPEGNRLVFFSPTVSNEKYYKVRKG